ncbi:MAG: hypothetical protein IJU56_10445 [Clostridia bacterium]|nr:hypothetical protein [Clostridia bacterium]
MISHIKLRARALQMQHRALFLGAFFIQSGAAVLLFAVSALAILYLRDFFRFFVPALCALLRLCVTGAGSLGSALCCLALAQGRDASLSRFLSAFHGKTLLRAVASLFLSAAAQGVLGAASSIPAGVLVFLLLRCLRRGFEKPAALLLFFCCVCAVCATLWLLFRLHVLFLPRSFFLASGAGARESVRACFRIAPDEQKQFLRFRRSFFGWMLLGVLLVPLPFVWGYFEQSRALLLKTLFPASTKTKLAA